MSKTKTILSYIIDNIWSTTGLKTNIIRDSVGNYRFISNDKVSRSLDLSQITSRQELNLYATLVKLDLTV